MRYLRLIVLVSAIFMPQPASAAQACERIVATGNPDYPPYLWRDPGNPRLLIGATADLLKRIFKEIGIDVEVIYTGPWSRAQEEVRIGRVDMLAGIFKTSHRMELLDFISPAILSVPSSIWVRADSALSIQQWSDLIAHSGGTLVNNSHGELFDNFASAHLQLESVPTAEQAFQKLLMGRNDYFVYELHPGIALVDALGLKGEVKSSGAPISNEGLYLAMSLNSSCNNEEVRRDLQRKVRELNSGAISAGLLENNIKKWDEQRRGISRN